MCGIAVAIDWNNAEATLHALAPFIQHRGLVSDPIVCPAKDVAFYTRRLPIVDEANGAQPKSSFDNRIVVAMNGEIYNHRALREELEGLGVRFKTDCDTEVLANALRAWGAMALPRLRGIFSFVSYDLVSGEFLAARDPFGVKPLYVVQRENGFLFCSEIAPLLAVTGKDQVLLLPPGHVLTHSVCAKFRLRRDPDAGEALTPETLDAILDEAVVSRLSAEQSVAALFSGGIDSTLLVHYAQRHVSALPAYFAHTTGSADYGFAKEYAELTGLDLRTVDIPDWSVATLTELMQLVETVETFEPGAIRPAYLTRRVAQRIHEDGYRVALCGEGADELFAGYPPLERAFAQSDALGRNVQEQCLALMHRVNLQRLDRCGMQHQVEIREPFLDLGLADRALALTGAELVAHKLGAMQGKQPLRAIYDLYPQALPGSIRDRQKLGFGEDLLGFGSQQVRALFDAEISDAEFEDGKREFSAFALSTKEEYFYLSTLSCKMDVSRVPHLKQRALLTVPAEFAARAA
ncbi:MAG TPA: asparagine synthetase B [Rhizomicrobium sp.]|jgi:asparagine synthase (glutamine-hydrolysing)